MGKPFGIAFRERVIKACDEGYGTRKVASRFEVSESWVRRLKQRRRELGSIAPLPNHPGPKPKLTDVHRRQLSYWLQQQPGLTLIQLQRRLPIRVCLETINRTLHQMKLTLKKSH